MTTSTISQTQIGYAAYTARRPESASSSPTTPPRRTAGITEVWEAQKAGVKASWNCARGVAQEAYLRAVFPERYEDVLADNNAATSASFSGTPPA
jgi:hypothetical protein